MFTPDPLHFLAAQAFCNLSSEVEPDAQREAAPLIHPLWSWPKANVWHRRVVRRHVQGSLAQEMCSQRGRCGTETFS
jgi:hypothetical protein